MYVLYNKRKLWKITQIHILHLKGHDSEADFLGFLNKLVPHKFLTLQYISSCSDFSFKFKEIFIIEKRLSYLPIRGVGHGMLKRKLATSVSRWVCDSLTRPVEESLSDNYSTIGKKYLWLFKLATWLRFYNNVKKLGGKRKEDAAN